jgi:hypothetical protein
MPGEEQVPGLGVEEIDQHEVETVFREIPESIATNICRLWIIEWRELVCDVHHIEVLVYLQDLTFEGSNEEILKSDV